MLHFHVRDATVATASLPDPLSRGDRCDPRARRRCDCVLQITTESGGTLSPAEQMACARRAGPEAVSLAIRELFAVRMMPSAPRGRSRARWRRSDARYPIHRLFAADLARCTALHAAGALPQRRAATCCSCSAAYADSAPGRPARTRAACSPRCRPAGRGRRARSAGRSWRASPPRHCWAAMSASDSRITYRRNRRRLRAGQRRARPASPRTRSAPAVCARRPARSAPSPSRRSRLMRHLLSPRRRITMKDSVPSSSLRIVRAAAWRRLAPCVRRTPCPPPRSRNSSRSAPAASPASTTRSAARSAGWSTRTAPSTASAARSNRPAARSTTSTRSRPASSTSA